MLEQDPIVLVPYFNKVLSVRSPCGVWLNRKNSGTALTWVLMLDHVVEVLQVQQQQQQRSSSQQHEEPQRPEDGTGPLHDRRVLRQA